MPYIVSSPLWKKKKQAVQIIIKKATCFGIHLTSVPHIFWKAVALSPFLVPMHQQAGCILPVLKCWLSTELPSNAAAPSSALSVRLCPLFQPDWSLAAARMHTGWGQSCHFRGHRQISASAGWCGCAPYNHPDVSNQLGFSYTPQPLWAPSEFGVPPSTAGNILWKWLRKSD